jgi:hypothetical protein
MVQETNLGGNFTLPGTLMTLKRMGYGAMQLTDPGLFGMAELDAIKGQTTAESATAQH